MPKQWHRRLREPLQYEHILTVGLEGSELKKLAHLVYYQQHARKAGLPDEIDRLVEQRHEVVCTP